MLGKATAIINEWITVCLILAGGSRTEIAALTQHMKLDKTTATVMSAIAVVKLKHVKLDKATATGIVNVLGVRNAGRIIAVLILAGEEDVQRLFLRAIGKHIPHVLILFKLHNFLFISCCQIH